MGQFERVLYDRQQSAGSTLWDVRIDDLILSRNFRGVCYGEA